MQLQSTILLNVLSGVGSLAGPGLHGCSLVPCLNF